MESVGYQVFKARGIYFIDSKKVKIKGSEVGYSLAKIEKILMVKQGLDTRINKQEIKQKIPQKQHHHFYNNSINNQQKPIKKAQKDTTNIERLSHESSHQKKGDNLIDLLMKPEKMEDKIAYEFLPKKKKQLKHHL